MRTNQTCFRSANIKFSKRITEESAEFHSEQTTEIEFKRNTRELTNIANGNTQLKQDQNKLRNIIIDCRKQLVKLNSTIV